MRLAAVGSLLLFVLGCNALQRGTCTVSDMPSAAPCAPLAEVSPCPPPPCQPSPKKCAEKPKEIEKNEQPREAQPIERTTTRSAVTQDILLIPRTVYVPYAPQVPVAPARLGTVAPAERVITQQETTREAAPPSRDAAPASQDRSAECLDKCTQMLERMDSLIRAMEQRQGQAAPACPLPAGSPPCTGPAFEEGPRPRRAIDNCPTGRN
jgi:hypothetical protein